MEDDHSPARDELQPQKGALGIVTGQQVTPTKVARSRELRREMTAAEQVLWRLVRAGKLGGLRFRRQQIVAGFIVDFYCHRARLVIELDGGVHEGQGDYDQERDKVLTARGLAVLRFSNRSVLEMPDIVLARIAKACAIED